MTRPGTMRFRHAPFPAIATTSLAFFALVIGPIAAGEGRGTDQGGESPPTLDQIAAVMNGRWDRVESLGVDYKETTEGLVDFKFIKKYLSYNGTTDLDKSYAYRGPRRYYRFKDNRKFDIDLAYDTDFDYQVIGSGLESRNTHPGEPVKPIPPVPKMPREAPAFAGSEAAWDGTRFLQKETGTSGGLDDPGVSAVVHGPSGVPDDLIQMPQDYLVGLGRTLPDPIHTEKDRKDRRLPDAFKLGGFVVRPKPEEVDGFSCVVVTPPGRDTYWLDPKVNCGVRESERLAPGSEVVRCPRAGSGSPSPPVHSSGMVTRVSCGKSRAAWRSWTRSRSWRDGGPLSMPGCDRPRPTGAARADGRGAIRHARRRPTHLGDHHPSYAAREEARPPWIPASPAPARRLGRGRDGRRSA
jgi:hypothetical protein